MNRLLAVLLGLILIFAVIVDVKVITGEGSIRWGIFVLYLVATALLAYGTLWFWRRGGSRRDAA